MDEQLMAQLIGIVGPQGLMAMIQSILEMAQTNPEALQALMEELAMLAQQEGTANQSMQQREAMMQEQMPEGMAFETYGPTTGEANLYGGEPMM